MGNAASRQGSWAIISVMSTLTNTRYDRALVDLAPAVLGTSKADPARMILSPKSPLISGH